MGGAGEEAPPPTPSSHVTWVTLPSLKGGVRPADREVLRLAGLGRLREGGSLRLLATQTCPGVPEDLESISGCSAER